MLLRHFTARIVNPFIFSRVNLLKPVTTHKIQSKCQNSTYKPMKSLESILTQKSVLFRPKNYSTKTPIGNAKPELPKFDKKYTPNKEDPNKKEDRRLFNLLGVFVGGVATYFAISYYLDYKRKQPIDFSINYSSQHLPGIIKPFKSIVRDKNPGNVKLTLYQFTTCPFCCKVRAYLDYFGYSYDIVEVNSLRKTQLDWSPGYKAVPVLAVQVPSKENPDEYDKEIIQLNDSSVIISAMETFRLDPSHSLKEILRYFEPLENDIDGNRTGKLDYSNKYFVMLYNENVKEGKTNKERKHERDWRSWVDSKFVHVISPNCYRTLGEAIETFRWFQEAGEWKKNFSSFECMAMVYVGAFVMFLISKRLKKKYELKENVRDSFDECSDEWTSTIGSKQIFKGGLKPNLADLALYGSMNSFVGCLAFEDMMKHDKIRAWFQAMKDQVSNSKGNVYLNNEKIKN